LVNNSTLQERRLERHSNNNSLKERTPRTNIGVTEDLTEVEDHSVEEADLSEEEEEVACTAPVAASAEAWVAVDS
jgi:actin-like ATPase involved in cell morphogenesis